MNMLPTQNMDPRLADFKLLLPLRPTARVLVVDCSDPQWLPYLCDEVAQVDLLAPADACPAMAQKAASDPTNLRRIAAPDGEYDIILSDTTAAAPHLRAGGVLCRFNLHSANPQAARRDASPPLKHLGRWWALPQWPAFRALVPDNPHAIKAADSELHLLSHDTGLMARLKQTLPARPSLAGRVCIDLFSRAKAEHPQCLIDQLDHALHPNRALDAVSDAPWLLVSGRLGPGNPVVVFKTSADGRLGRLIKIARYPGTRHLIEEAAKINEIRIALGETLAAPLIVPTAVGTYERRAAIAYHFVATLPFFGLRWRLHTRAGYCDAMSAWLAGVAQRTVRKLPLANAEANHIRPLADLCARGILPTAMQQAAEQALGQLLRCDTLPECLEHGDLGIYNTRLCSHDGRQFRVIDWASSTPSGIALGDLGYLLASAHAPQALSTRCLARYLDALALPRALASALWFSYLARRWAELDTVRPPVVSDPTSGGGILIDVHARIAPSLERLGR